MSWEIPVAFALGVGVGWAARYALTYWLALRFLASLTPGEVQDLHKKVTNFTSRRE